MPKLGKTGSLLAMLSVTASFFLVELIVGYMTHSMALVADSFHMLSDVLALLVAYLSVRISKQTSTINTFGWARAEVLGALVNAVFLMALCFSIFVEAIDRFTSPEEVKQPKLVLIVGCIGLAMNLFGLLIFHQHSHAGHSHGGGGDHGHGHGHAGHSHAPKKPKIVKNGKAITESERNGDVKAEQVLLVKSGLPDDLSGTATDNHTDQPVSASQHIPPPQIASSSQLNMRGVFLHVLGDALGSVVVIVSAIVVWCTEWEYNKYIDPSMSILLVLIISYTTFPLLRDSALILMQTVPTHIEIEDIRKRLLEIEGVHAVHELHIWQLAGDRIIASAHIRCHNLQEYMRVAGKIKQFFHDVGIHSTTMQPEFEDTTGEPQEETTLKDISTCIIACPSDAKNCSTSVCCPPLPSGKLAAVVVIDPNGPANLSERARSLEQVLHTSSSRRSSGIALEPVVAPPSYTDTVNQRPT